jgi:hypothetical protein
MQDNMQFFHRKAREVLATIMAMPLGTDVNEDQLQALKDLLGVIKMREMSQMCVRDLARYTHPPMAPRPRVMISRLARRRSNAPRRRRPSARHSGVSWTACHPNLARGSDPAFEMGRAPLGSMTGR